MKPEVDLTLRVLATQLLAEIAPAFPTDYGRGNLELTGGLLLAAAEEYDRAAEVRAVENREMRRIFREAASDVPDAAFRARLEAAAIEAEPSLRIAALNEANDRLRKLLVELHAAVEERSDPAARRIDRAIWDELRASVARRAFSFVPF
jgi:uncharacterized membrane protein